MLVGGDGSVARESQLSRGLRRVGMETAGRLCGRLCGCHGVGESSAQST